MTYEIAGSRQGATLRQPEATGQGKRKKRDPASPEVLRLRGRMQAFLAAAVALGIFCGTHIATHRHTDLSILSDRTLQGRWDLLSVGGEPIGPKVASGVLSQQLFFDHGKLHGETRLLASTPAGATQMPFPDQSVKQVRVSPEGYDAVATWEGSYRLLDAHQMALYVGQARYLVRGSIDPKAHALILDHDAILTYQGASRYKSGQQHFN